MTDQQTN